MKLSTISNQLAFFVLVCSLAGINTLRADEPRPQLQFEKIVIDNNLPGGYQVEVADVNGDGKPDIVGLGGGTCAWYENPSWKKRIVSNAKQSPGIISTATFDINGDGKAEIAIAYEFSMNEPTKGKLLLAHQGQNADDPWKLTPVADVGSIHRLRWLRPGTNSNTSKSARLCVVAPIFGPSAKGPAFQQEPAHLALFETQIDPKPVLLPTPRIVGDTPVLHAIDVADFDGDGRADILGASNRGVTRFDAAPIPSQPHYEILVTGAPGEAPKKGASEIHSGRLKDGRRFLATVEPWHGTDVAVYLSESIAPLKFGPRTVIDTSMQDGHALWVADVDGDGDDEVFAGFRGKGTSVLAFDFNGKTWERVVVDNAIAAQDLRGGDLDSDGTPDVVAIGGQTHNVVWYRPIRKSR